jgi:pSer/pThr/pTyr-binding forkhead associated (FHA) protein
MERMSDEQSQDGEAPPLALKGLVGEHKGKIYPVGSGITIGRDLSSDIVVTEGAVSRKHATVVDVKGTLAIIDNNSSNGTIVNGNKIETATLNLKDHIKFDKSEFEVVKKPNISRSDETILRVLDKADRADKAELEEMQKEGEIEDGATQVLSVDAYAELRAAAANINAKQKTRKSSIVELLGMAGPSIGLIIGIVVAVAVIGGAAFFLLAK